MSTRDIIEALEQEENFQKFQNAVNQLSDEELDETKSYFNQVTSHDDLGDILFYTGNSFDDVKIKIADLDDEDQQKFICAIM